MAYAPLIDDALPIFHQHMTIPRQGIFSLLFLILPLLAACERQPAHRIDESIVYQDEEHEKNALNGLLAHEQYQSLDAALIRSEQQYAQQHITARQLHARWNTLANINADGVISLFDRWVASTGSGQSYLARGMHLQVLAWEARGAKMANQTSASQFAAFKRLAAKAEQDLIIAAQMLPQCTLCAGERIRIHRALDRPISERRQMLDDALRIDPRMPAAVFSFFPSLYPQWGGSFEQMRAFIRDMEKQVPDASIIAELESRFCWEQARAAEANKDEEAAFAWYKRGVTAHPYDMLMKNLAESYSERGEHRTAADILEQNLRINDPWDLYSIGAAAAAYLESGQQEKGMAMLRKRDEAQWRYNNFK